MMEQYYGEDLSLSEIAENSSITRQGVHDNIKRAASELKEYERKLGLLGRFTEITNIANEIKALLKDEITEDTVQKISSLLDVIVEEA